MGEQDGDTMETDVQAENGSADVQKESFLDKLEKSTDTKPAEPKMEKKIKKKTKRVELKVTQQVVRMTKRELDDALELECKMAVTDKVIVETTEAKNNVETYVYDLRDKLSSAFSEFVIQAEQEELQGLLQQTEDWLYEDGDDLPKAEYVKKLEELKALGDPIERRWMEAAARPVALESLWSTVTAFRESAASSNEDYAHIEQADKDKVVAECASVEAWLAEKSAAQDKLAKHEDVVLASADIKKKETELQNLARSIMSKSKPKPKPPAPKREEPAEELKDEQMADTDLKKEELPAPMEVETCA